MNSAKGSGWIPSDSGAKWITHLGMARGAEGVYLRRCGTGGAYGPATWDVAKTTSTRSGYLEIKIMVCSLADADVLFRRRFRIIRFPNPADRQLIWPIMESAHYFSAQPAGPFTRKPLTVDLAGETRRLQTSSGIFSPDGIDKGTAVLLADVPAPAPQGNLLDIGCGWGPIALTMALRAPHAKVYAVDVNERCVTLTNENAGLLGLDNLTASTPEAVEPELRFDTIWSNPPIRIGKDELHALLRLWIPRLAPGGSAWLVVQKNLGSDSLQRWLAAELDSSFSVTRESTSKSFRILRIRKASH